MRRSQHAAIPAPPPAQAPLIAAIVGPGTAPVRQYPINPCLVVDGILRSLEGAKLIDVGAGRECLVAAPLRISTLSERSLAALAQISASRSYILNVSEFLACGRLR